MSFSSRIDPNAPDFAKNRADMLALVDKLRELEARPVALSEQRR